MQDDKQSLAELHDYISGYGLDTADETPKEESVFPLPLTPTRTSSLAQTKAERRRSLPARASMASVSSELTVLPSPPPADNAFQQRRRRAAKLTQFFGVNYRDLMNEILDSIEKGLEEERGRGTMKPDEIQVRCYGSACIHRTVSDRRDRTSCKSCAGSRRSAPTGRDISS